jgi:hypothetical protein
MFLNVKFYDASWALVGEVNPYEDLVTVQNAGGNEVYVSGGNLTVTNEELVYECVMSSAFTGENHTKHFLLADDRYKDNRIPPKGFDTGGMYERIVQPRWNGSNASGYFTASEYTGGYDEVNITKPAGTVYWNATLNYQTTSKEYVEFLWTEINGTAPTLTSPTPSGEAQAYVIQTDPFFSEMKDWGYAMWDLWLHNEGAAPVVMETLNGSSPAPPEYTVELHEGGNLISLPLAQADEAIDQALGNISGKWDMIQAFDAASPTPWKSNFTFRPDFLDDLDSLNHSIGFWINITEPDVNFTVKGTQAVSTDITLYAGWNLVGYPTLNTTRTIADALAGTGYDAVEGYNATAPYRLSQLADTYVMTPGEAYWVHVNSDTVWTVTAEVPSIQLNSEDAPAEVCCPEPEDPSDCDHCQATDGLELPDEQESSEVINPIAFSVLLIPAFSMVVALRLPKRRD